MIRSRCRRPRQPPSWRAAGIAMAAAIAVTGGLHAVEPGAAGVGEGVSGTLESVGAATRRAAPVVNNAPKAGGPGTTGTYIVGFVRYVHWPDEEQLSAWTVCTPVGLPADQVTTYAAQTVRGKPLAVRNITVDDELAGCQVLDLTTADVDDARTILQRSRGQPVFSVGSGAAFCSAGGLVCLQPPNSARKFEVNLSAVKASGLKVSARLLMLGTDRPARRILP